MLRAVLSLVAGLLMLALPRPAAAQGDFRAFVEALKPEAVALGVTPATFDAAFAGLTPDMTLPDLVLPGREKQASSKGQAEFVRPPQDYLNKAQLANLAVQGKALATKHAAALGRIEREIGVDRYSVLAIWGRETAFGVYKPAHDAIRVLATQAYTGRRKEMFRKELLYALKMLQNGVPRAVMRASWAGAMGLTQFMPTEFVEYATDMDGDGKADLFNSVPDALASAAKQLMGKGWVPGIAWGYEIRRPAVVECALEGPGQGRPIAEWVKLGVVRTGGRSFSADEMRIEAYLMMPAGAYGPAFLVTENFKTIRRYNMSDLYALFVGNLADRIAGGGDFETPWSDPRQLATRDIEEIQRHLARSSTVEKIDGKIGSETRQRLGAYQKANGLKVDCWPGDDVLRHLRSAATAR